MNPYIDVQKASYEAAVEKFKQDIERMRTGHANPGLLDGIMVNAYETMTPLKQLASITVPEPKLIVVQPWDKSILKEIEKAIAGSNLGFSPVNDGEVIRVPMPQLTEENRKELVKLVKEKTENVRIAIRQVRDKIKDSVVKAEKAKEITEDDKYLYIKQLDEFTSDQVKTVNELSNNKEDQIMKI